MAARRQDRFYNTDVDKILKEKGITTLILMGWKVSGSVTIPRSELQRATTPVDAAMARTDYETGVGIFQTLNQADSNPTNQPLKRKATTISRTDLITIPVRLVRAA